MRNLLFSIAAIVGFGWAAVAALTSADATAKPGENLKYYPKGTDTKLIKKDMRVQARALGVTCDFCHELGNFADDSNEHKLTARNMMRMVDRVNAKLKKDGFEPYVECMTCHQGQEHPPD